MPSAAEIHLMDALVAEIAVPVLATANANRNGLSVTGSNGAGADQRL